MASIIKSNSALKRELDTKQVKLKFANLEQGISGQEFIAEIKARDDRFKDKELEVAFSYRTVNKKCAVINFDLDVAKSIMTNPETSFDCRLYVLEEFSTQFRLFLGR